MEWLLGIGSVFILIVFSLRYYFYRSMTQKVCSLEPDNDYCRKHYKENLDTSNDPYTKCDVIYGETPHGGAKTIICYVDENNKMTSKQKAIKVLVREFDQNKKPVFETWTSLND